MKFNANFTASCDEKFPNLTVESMVIHANFHVNFHASLNVTFLANSHTSLNVMFYANSHANLSAMFNSEVVKCEVSLWDMGYPNFRPRPFRG